MVQLPASKLELLEILNDYYGETWDLVESIIINEYNGEIPTTDLIQFLHEINARAQKITERPVTIITFAYCLLSDLISTPDPWFKKIIEEFPDCSYPDYLILGLLSLEYASSQDLKLEISEQMHELIPKIDVTKFPTTILIKFLLNRGNLFWELGILSSAVSSFNSALNSYLAKSDQPSEIMADMCRKLGNMWELVGNYKKAASYYELALNFMKNEENEENIGLKITLQALTKKAFFNAAQTFLTSSRAHLWLDDYEQAMKQLAHAVYSFSKLGQIDPKAIKEQEAADVGVKLLEAYRYIRSDKTLFDFSPYLDRLYQIRNPTDRLNLLKKLEQETTNYIQPTLYYLLITQSSGPLVYSYNFESERIGRSGLIQQRDLDDDVLYAALLSAVSDVMSEAVQHEPLKVITHGNMTVMIEEGDYLRGFIFVDRESNEVREYLREMIFAIEREYAHVIERSMLLENNVGKVLIQKYILNPMKTHI